VAYSPSGFLFGSVIVLAALSALSAFILIHYYNKDVFSSLTYLANDTWCTIGQGQGLGVHCFGDYASVVLSTAQQNPWLAAEGHISNYPASGMLPQWFFGAIGYLFNSHRVGLFLYLIVLAVALTAPAIWASKGKTPTMRMITIGLFGLFATPAIMTLERGNSIGFVVPALLAYLVALRRERYTIVVVATIIASLVKPQFILLVLVLIILRKWKYALITLGGALVANVLAYLVWPRDFPASLFQSADAILNYGGGVSLADQFPSNISLAKGLYWIELWTRFLIGRPNPHSWTAQNPMLASVVVLAVVIVTLIILGRRIPSHIAAIVLMACTSLFVGTSWSYYLVFALPIAAIMLRDPRSGVLDRYRWRGALDDLTGSIPKKIAVGITAVAVAATLMQIALPIGATIPGTPPADFAQATVLHTTVDFVPALWLLAVFVILLAWALPDKRSHENSGADIRSEVGVELPDALRGVAPAEGTGAVGSEHRQAGAQVFVGENTADGGRETL
jgi:hypothetical protein